MKRYRRPFPGYLQMDIKYVPYKIEGQQFYQFSLIDHHSSWRLIRCYKNKGGKDLEQFLYELELHCPFPIEEIQTDNDATFTDKFTSVEFSPTGNHDLDRWCYRKEINHRLIPPGVKELNGKVENSHKWDDREFYSQHQFETFEHLELGTKIYNTHWNKIRATKTLGWKTPSQVVLNATEKAAKFLYLIKALYPGKVIRATPNAIGGTIFHSEPLDMTIEPMINIVVEPDPEPKPKKIKKRKRLNYVDRYIQYLEWDSKKYPKIIFPISPMSQNFSRSY